MLIRFRIKGFKSLEDVDLRFGALTVLVGPNDSGKSNVLDAINFLSRLCDGSVADAAAGVRPSAALSRDAVSIFSVTRHGRAETMTLTADFLVDQHVADHQGHRGTSAATALRYQVCLRRQLETAAAPAGIVIESETLEGISSAELADHIGFDMAPSFLESLHAGASSKHFLSMDADHPGTLLVAAEERGAPPTRFALGASARTFLSTCETIERPTALAARREMQRWCVMRLEVAALRRPDGLHASPYLAPDGAHLPSVLERLNCDEAMVYRLAALVPRVTHITVDIDQLAGSKTFHVETVGEGRIDAASLSDGTLRMLAFAAIAMDPDPDGLICIEEPENSLHPSALRLLVNLIGETVVDARFPVDADNPLRQILLVTHAPNIVQAAGIDDVLVAATYNRDGARFSIFSPLAGSWRARSGVPSAVGFGALLSYLESGDGDAVEADSPASVLRSYRHLPST
ncbi:AAA family ATPase [Massilia sp. TWP1-3-3]|uniref:AAA family ATPase n=1 Tax=Massilia sp. TWP1-3-3 TaxID=2804573 RepID=UPI003CEF5BD4